MLLRVVDHAELGVDHFRLIVRVHLLIDDELHALPSGVGQEKLHHLGTERRERDNPLVRGGHFQLRAELVAAVGFQIGLEQRVGVFGLDHGAAHAVLDLVDDPAVGDHDGIDPVDRPALKLILAEDRQVPLGQGQSVRELAVLVYGGHDASQIVAGGFDHLLHREVPVERVDDLRLFGGAQRFYRVGVVAADCEC